jgi:ribosome maturation factor RimP
MDRPLVKPKDFKRFVGHAIKITLIEAVQNHKRFVATLTSADDQGVQLSLLKEAEPLLFDISYGQIQTAKLYIDFDNYRLKGTSGDTSTH